jgi:adenosylcobinamide-phosphate synthase
MIYLLQVLAAVLLDCLVGDPRSLPHPVRFIGKLCSYCEVFFRSAVKDVAIAGALTVLTVLAITGLVTALLLSLLGSFYPLVADIAAILILYTSIAARDLARHSGNVYLHLEAEDLAAARMAVAMIVGRDTEVLDRNGVCRAAVETVAENTVDGVTAPLFSGFCCGLLAPVTGLGAIELTAVGAMLYKATNTMDSMFGYKNETYFDFGRVAARLDDAVNFLPARLTSLFLILAAALLRLDWRGAMRIFFRDRLRHASPNAGHPEAAVAGALRVRLGGPSRYFGSIVEKPYIGDDLQAIEPGDILKANKLMYLGSLLFLVFLLCGRIFFVER